ncbi:metallophosphoesterase family protein [Paracoccus cavernae]|uniref:metallophosphoesterase family protein n=1 Tax=Paracoccus cavernae TaxID=1571207 RepID=UPI0036345422
MTKIAVIADPHVHDCSWQPENSGLTGAIRSFAETAASTRVFNESIPAFRAALERAVAEGAKLVLLVGDLTDDGQEPNIRAALKILADYRQRHGLRVLATPGNHDFYALAGRPQIKTFLTADGAPVVVDSAHSPDAATIGTAPALKLMAHLGYRPEPSDLHWETPFGTDPDFAARSYLVASPDGQSRVQMIDSSYLVEPVAESGFSRWTPMSARRAMGWSIPPIPRPITTRPMAVGARSWRIAPICSAGWPMLPRAKAQGKQLISFSHYPVLDPLGGASAEEVAIFGATGLARRAPPAAAAKAFAATGVPLHFSGHLHVNDCSRHDGPQPFFNLATPSPVGFPPAMKLIESEGPRLTLRTLDLAEVPDHDLAYAAYQAEAARAGRVPPAASHAENHGAFMDHHLSAVVQDRYIPREWPPEMAAFLRAGICAIWARCWAAPRRCRICR